MIQNHHRRLIKTDLAEDIVVHQVLRATVQAAEVAAGVIAVAVAVHIIHHHQQKNVKINRLQATWIKFDRFEHQHRQN